MTEIIVAAITAEGAIIAAALVVIIPLLWKTRKDAKASKEQLVNSHATNMREEQDERHQENIGRLGRLEHSVHKIEEHLGIEDTRPPIYDRS